MSLEQALAENTATMKELIAALLSVGAVQTAQVSSAAHSSPAVKAVVKAQNEADAKETAAKKQQKPATAGDAAATPAAEAASESKPSGEQSAPTGESSSSELQPWAEKTADKFAELKDAEPNLENVRKAILGINSLIGRTQADAVLGRFGAQAVTTKADKKGLDEEQYGEFLELCLRVLAGEVDATLSISE